MDKATKKELLKQYASQQRAKFIASLSMPVEVLQRCLSI